MILQDEGSGFDLGAVSAAWTPGAPSFALLPARFDMGRPWAEAALAALPAPLRNDHFLLTTSGSTGAPKLLVASRGRAERMAAAIAEEQGLDGVERLILTLPLSYCFALVNQWVLGQRRDLPMVQAGFDDPAALKAALEAPGAAMICLVGAQVPLLAGLGGGPFPQVAHVAFAGSPFPWAQADLLARLFPRARFSNNYGCAEAMPRLVVRDVTDALRQGTPPAPGYLGQALPGIALRSSAAGALEFSSPYAALGYLTPEGFEPFEKWIATGDMARQEADGWHLLGRANEVFKRHGEKISLSRLRGSIDGAWEGLYALVPGVDRSGEAGVELILQGPADKAAARGVLRALRAAHPRAYWPLRILAVDSLPRLGNGKIDLAALAAQDTPEVLWDQRV